MWENSTYKIYVRVESWSQKSSKYATCKGYVSTFFILDSMHFTQYELSEVITFIVLERQVKLCDFLPGASQGII